MNSQVNRVQRQWFQTKGVSALREMGFRAGQRILDFGCGPGRFTVPLSRIVAPAGGRVIAIDRSKKSLRELRRRLAEFGEAEAIESVPVKTKDGIAEMAVGPVDAVLAFDVLQHVTDWDTFFKAAADALKPSGTLYIYPANGPHPDAVNMDAVRSAVEACGFRHTATHRLRLPHAHSMVEDCIHAFQRKPGVKRGLAGISDSQPHR